MSLRSLRIVPTLSFPITPIILIRPICPTLPKFFKLLKFPILPILSFHFCSFIFALCSLLFHLSLKNNNRE